MTIEASVYIITLGKEVEVDVVPEKKKEKSIMNIEKYFAEIGTMDEQVEADSVPYQQNEKVIGDIEDIIKPTDN